MKLHLSIFLLLGYFAGFGQTPVAELPKVIGPSPSVASIQKYGDYQVGTYTGAPGINIPLYTINVKDLTVPISISYHGSGIKVAEESSRVGLGWSLTAGGSISRSILGLDDLRSHSLHPKSFDLIGFPIRNVISTTYLPFGGYTYDINNKVGGMGVDPAFPGIWADFEPDVFSYNFLGNSGKFVIRKQDTAAIFEDPSTNMTIKFLFTDPNSCQIIATASDGTMYYFEKFETCITEGPVTVPSKITAWYLTKIQSVKGTIVNFNYLESGTGTTYTLNTPSDFVYVHHLTAPYKVVQKSMIPHNKYNNLLLSSITFSNGSVSFVYGDRIDVQGDKKLTSLIVSNADGLIIKKINLIQDYFTANSSGNNTIDLGPALWGGPGLDSNWIKKRLKLTELQEVSSDNQIVLKHEFHYNENLLPLKNSTSRDHWGYFNNAPNGTSMIPSLAWAYPGLVMISAPPQYSCTPSSQGDFSSLNKVYQENPHKYYDNYSGANREVDTSYSKAFMLTKIVYPTGGNTQFTFEQNTYDKKKSFAKDHNAELTNYSLNTQQLAFLAGISSIPAGTLQTFNFSITAADTLPGESVAIVNLKFSAQKSSPLTTHSNMTWVRLKTASGTLISELGFNEFADFSSVVGNICSFDFLPQRLQIGNYKIEILLSGNTVDKSCIIYRVVGTWYKTLDQNTDGIKYKYGGGLRIKNVSSYTSDSLIASSINYRYHFVSDLNQNGILEEYSTGKIMDRPNYFDVHLDYISKSSVKIKSEANINGNIGYDSVITEQNSIRHLDAYYNAPYRTIKYPMYYTSPGNEMMPGYLQFPFTTMNGVGLPGNQLNFDIFFAFKPDGLKNFTDNANGKLLRSIDYLYNTSANNYTVLKDVENQYIGSGDGTTGVVWADRILTTFGGVASGIKNDSGYVVASCLIGLPIIYGATNFFYPALRSSAVLLSKQTEKSYEETDSLVTITTYAYNYRYQLKKKVQNNSRGEVIATNLKYPLDYTITGTANNNKALAIQNLINKNIITPVIEQYIEKSNTDGSNLRTTASLFGSYKTTVPFSDTIYKIESAQALTNFATASITASTTTIDSRYKPQIIFNNYDPAGNILEVQKDRDVLHSYLWDYQTSYPIAEITNASQASIAFTSFESDGSGNWNIGSAIRITNDGITGKKSYQLSNGPVSKSGLSTSSTYMISYWSKSGPQTISGSSSVISGKTIGLWTYYEHSVSNPSGGIINVSGTGIIDELRLYPKGALMTTYTYTPLIGITSQCDPNNRISYYEYDNFGRLKLIKDEDGKILKLIDYKYQATYQQ